MRPQVVVSREAMISSDDAANFSESTVRLIHFKTLFRIVLSILGRLPEEG